MFHVRNSNTINTSASVFTKEMAAYQAFGENKSI